MHRHPKIIEKPWGKFEEYSTNEKTTVKIISVNKGEILSLQSHKHRDELWVALDDGLTAQVNEKEILLSKGETVFVPKRIKHRIKASEDARFLEISFGEFDENDIVRYEDKYNRI